MPANLTPQYLEADKRFKAAREPEEKLEILEEMIRLIPKHKGTDHMLADLRRKRSELKKDIEQAKVKGQRGPSYRIPREGGGQVALLGPPNAGKSSILGRLTNAAPEVAPFPFTTREPVPGMMPYKDIAFQLIDTPPVTTEFMFPWLVEIARNADAALLVADLASESALEDVAAVKDELAARKVELVGPEIPDDRHDPVRSLHTMLVGNKSDAPGAADRFEILRELFGPAFPAIAVSAQSGAGLEDLRHGIFVLLDVIRVYTKVPGGKADRDAPFVLRRGSTVLDLAALVHREFADTLKYARLWGEGVYEGQTVKRDHVLHDGDVAELHA